MLIAQTNRNSFRYQNCVAKEILRLQIAENQPKYIMKQKIQIILQHHFEFRHIFRKSISTSWFRLAAV